MRLTPHRVEKPLQVWGGGLFKQTTLCYVTGLYVNSLNTALTRLVTQLQRCGRAAPCPARETQSADSSCMRITYEYVFFFTCAVKLFFTLGTTVDSSTTGGAAKDIDAGQIKAMDVCFLSNLERPISDTEETFKASAPGKLDSGCCSWNLQQCPGSTSDVLTPKSQHHILPTAPSSRFSCFSLDDPPNSTSNTSVSGALQPRPGLANIDPLCNNSLGCRWSLVLSVVLPACGRCQGDCAQKGQLAHAASRQAQQIYITMTSPPPHSTSQHTLSRSNNWDYSSDA